MDLVSLRVLVRDHLRRVASVQLGLAALGLIVIAVLLAEGAERVRVVLELPDVDGEMPDVEWVSALAARSLLLTGTMLAVLFASHAFHLRVRFTEQELALPVDGRTRLLARLLALVGLAVLPPLVLCAVDALSDLEHARTALAAGASVAAAAALALVLLHAPERGFAEARPGPGLWAAGLAGGGVLALAFLWPSASFALIVGGAALGIGAGLVAAAPASQTLGRAQPRAATRGRARGGLGPTRLLLREGWLRPRVALLSVLVWCEAGLIGLSPAGNAGYLVMMLAFLCIATGMAAHAVRACAHLPVPLGVQRRALVLPAFVLAAGCVVACAAAAAGPRVTFERDLEPVDLERTRLRTLAGDGPFHWHVDIPADRWRLGLGWRPEPVVAPWGERVERTPRPLFWGLPVHVHNPYEIGAESSLRFVAWQLARAASEAYGADVRPEAIEPLLEVNSLGDVGPRERVLSDEELLEKGYPIDEAWAREQDDLSLQVAFPHLELRPVPNRLALAALVVVALTALALRFGLAPNVPPLDAAGRHRRFVRRAWLVVALVALALVPIVVSFGDREVLGLAAGAAARALGEALPAPLAWAIVAAAAVGTYLQGGRWLQRRETPPPLPPTPFDRALGRKRPSA